MVMALVDTVRRMSYICQGQFCFIECLTCARYTLEIEQSVLSHDHCSQGGDTNGEDKQA